MTSVPLELIGPAALTVALLYVVWGKVLKDPPAWYSRREYADLELELARAEADRDWYYREALEANGVTGKALDLVRRRESGGDSLPPTAPAGPWAPRPERDP
jgi:hypothetical protein